MSLFRRKSDNSSMTFNCLWSTDSELKEITKLVKENGGKMGKNCPLEITFMNRSNYEDNAYSPNMIIYDIDFIRVCVNESKLVSLSTFRLTPKKDGENCVKRKFFYGYCSHQSDNEEMDERPIPEIVIKKDPLDDPTVPIDESQPVVSPAYAQSLRSFANNGDSPARSTSPDKNTENRSSNCEYKDNVNPNIPRSSSPTNDRDDKSRSPQASSTSLSYETPMDFVEVKQEPPDSIDWNCPTNSPGSKTTKETLSVSLSDLPQVTPTSPTVPRSQSLENLLLSPRVTLERCVVMPKVSSTKEPEKKNNDLRVITEARVSSKKKKSSWIATNDDWLRKSKSNRIYPVTEHVQHNDGSVPLVRPNLTHGNRSTMPNTTLVPNPKYRSRSISNKDEENRPGPSGLNTKKQKVNDNPIVAFNSSDDEESEEAPNVVKRGAVNGRGKARVMRLLPVNKKNLQIVRNMGDAEEHEENARENRIVSDSDDENITPHRPRDDAGDTGNVRRISSDNDSDEDHAKQKKKIKLSKREKYKRTLEYAKNWRLNMEADRPMKRRKTNMPYTKAEQKAMVDYLCTYDDILASYPKGLKIWHTMLLEGILPHRTAQSLQNHFMKHLLPHIQDYFDGLSANHRKQFLALQSQKGRN